jgi:hypothetical protein
MKPGLSSPLRVRPPSVLRDREYTTAARQYANPCGAVTELDLGPIQERNGAPRMNGGAVAGSGFFDA